ncbi:hypothetical protein ACP275_02G124900 [Erythranthe tilingii]
MGKKILCGAFLCILLFTFAVNSALATQVCVLPVPMSDCNEDHCASYCDAALHIYDPTSHCNPQNNICNCTYSANECLKPPSLSN